MTNELEKQFTSVCSTESRVQQYECQVIKNDIAFDGCLWQELNWLWRQGIETIGCCCGHHINCPHNMAYIQVKSMYEQDMIDLGYKRSVNEFGAVLFKPKTKIINSLRSE